MWVVEPLKKETKDRSILLWQSEGIIFCFLLVSLQGNSKVLGHGSEAIGMDGEMLCFWSDDQSQCLAETRALEDQHQLSRLIDSQLTRHQPGMHRTELRAD